jgi:hypothetical protein
MLACFYGGWVCVRTASGTWTAACSRRTWTSSWTSSPSYAPHHTSALTRGAADADGRTCDGLWLQVAFKKFADALGMDVTLAPPPPPPCCPRPPAPWLWPAGELPPCLACCLGRLSQAGSALCMRAGCRTLLVVL